ncbi:recombinase family protein [Larkinella sp. GY13]|uniref:recombinase family protein n=1 Tax=Larkinella sp. GY13 TaxID=3453720 RepID=UPI003EE8AC3E
MKYIAYYRVSTQKQGRSGLGLDDQRDMVRRFLRVGEELAGEFTEIESGKKKERPQLLAAIDAAKQHRARLLIAKLDRLGRNASFVMTLRDTEVDFVACDLPDANTLTIGIMASFAQHEAEQISKRTRAALAQKKIRGFQLGKPENLTATARIRGQEIRIQNAIQHLANRQAGELIQLYRQKDLTFREITAKLNENGYRTRRGKLFFPMSVARLLKRYLFK